MVCQIYPYFKVLYDDCAFPLEFAYYMFGHAFIFFVLFAHFYIKAYLTPKTKLKVRFMFPIFVYWYRLIY